MTCALILLGSNIQPEVNIPRAVRLLEKLFDVRAVSSAWETPAVGSDGPNFINTAVMLETQSAPADLKSGCLRLIEQRFGRVRTSDKNAPRPIDLDVVVYGSEVLEPEIWLRAHLALPVAELLPELINPQTRQPLEKIAGRLRAFAIHRPDVIQFHTRQ